MRGVAFSLCVAILPTLAAPAAGAPRDKYVLQRVALNHINIARGQVGLGPLVWNKKLEDDAELYARQMAYTGVFAHDRRPERRRIQGENIWRGTRGYWPYEAMIDSMVAERRYYRPGPFPSNSVNGNWAAVGHYTQIIWPTTTMVGCALASGPQLDYLVCRFAPKGNVDGVMLP